MDKPQEHIQNEELNLIKNELSQIVVPTNKLQTQNLFTQLDKEMPVKETRSWLKVSVGLLALGFICSTLFIILPEKKEFHKTEDKTTKIDSSSSPKKIPLQLNNTQSITNSGKEKTQTEVREKTPLKTKSYSAKPSTTSDPKTIETNFKLPKKDTTVSQEEIATIIPTLDSISATETSASEIKNPETNEVTPNGFNLNNMKKTKTRDIFK